MALTCTWTQTVFGDRRCAFGNVTVAGQTSGAIATPLSIIQGGSIEPYSVTSAVPGFIAMFNRASGATAVNGYLCIQTCTAGDVFSVFVFGE
jgi:hypothetical protein